MKDFDVKEFNIYENLLRKQAESIINSFNTKKESILIERLKDLGFEFESKIHFYHFVKERITRLVTNPIELSERFYLDYVDPNNLGIFLFGTAQEVVSNPKTYNYSVSFKLYYEERKRIV